MCRKIAQSQEMSTRSNFKEKFMRRVRHIFGLTLFWMHNFGNRKLFMKLLTAENIRTLRSFSENTSPISSKNSDTSLLFQGALSINKLEYSIQ